MIDACECYSKKGRSEFSGRVMILRCHERMDGQAHLLSTKPVDQPVGQQRSQQRSDQARDPPKPEFPRPPKTMMDPWGNRPIPGNPQNRPETTLQTPETTPETRKLGLQTPETTPETRKLTRKPPKLAQTGQTPGNHPKLASGTPETLLTIPPVLWQIGPPKLSRNPYKFEPFYRFRAEPPSTTGPPPSRPSKLLTRPLQTRFQPLQKRGLWGLGPRPTTKLGISGLATRGFRAIHDMQPTQTNLPTTKLRKQLEPSRNIGPIIPNAAHRPLGIHG